MLWNKAVGLAACCLLVGSSLVCCGADPVPSTTSATGGKVLVAKNFRVSKLTGMNVRNAEGEKLGTIEDFVTNLDTGKISYAALSFGGLFGIGDKLFAIPFDQLKFDHGKDEMFFVLNVPKEKLKAAPGFDKSHWPDFADPHWMQQIDNYYREHQTTTKKVSQ